MIGIEDACRVALGSGHGAGVVEQLAEFLHRVADDGAFELRTVSLAFTRLQQILDLTAGNLSTHLRKLEDAGYVEVTKVIEGRTPATYLALTDAGRAAFTAYRKALAQLLGG